MTMQSRLQRATHALSPLQRAVFVLQVLHDGREPDPELRRIDDPVQRRAFNRYMALLWVANHHLGSIAAITSHRVELAENAAHYWQLFNEVAGLMEEEHGLKPSKPFRNWRARPVVTVPGFLRSLALEARDDAVRTIEHLWKEALALESVWAELALEFDGEDIVLPENRERQDETRERLRVAAKTVGLRRLPAEPEDDMIQACHEAVSESFRHLGYAEPFA